MNQRVRNIIFWVLIFGIIALAIYLIRYIHSNSYECMNNPYTYGIKLLEKSNGADVTAIYTVQKPGGAIVILTRDGFQASPQSTDFVMPQLQFDLEKVK